MHNKLCYLQVDPRPLEGKINRDTIYPACLPDIHHSYMNKIVTVAGWGETKARLIRVSEFYLVHS